VPFPTLDELEAAYEAGRTAEPASRNPHFFASPLYIQWDYGRRDSIQQSGNRLQSLARNVLWAGAATIAFSILRYTLL
jgi:hypothetical protein